MKKRIVHCSLCAFDMGIRNLSLQMDYTVGNTKHPIVCDQCTRPIATGSAVTVWHEPGEVVQGLLFRAEEWKAPYFA